MRGDGPRDALRAAVATGSASVERPDATSGIPDWSVLADRLEADKPLTPRLVEQAREEFDCTVQRLADIPPEKVTSAIRTTEIAWEMEKLQRGES